MSVQINFFLSPSDSIVFEQVIRRSGSICFLKDQTCSPQPEQVETTEVLNYGHEPLRLLIARADDLPSLNMKALREKSLFFAHAGTGLFIEYDRCFVSKNLIRAGRIYSDLEILKGDSIVKKPAEFVLWSKRLLNLCRRSLSKIDDTFYYAGQDALRLRQNGVVFDPLDGRE